MEKQREHWSSRLGFILAATGSAVGLGTLWQFPYVTAENGGGLFVLVYLLCTLVIGIPIFMAELILGRKAQRGAVGIFLSFGKHAPAWKVIGWMGVASSFLIMSYYSVVAGYGLNYILMSLNEFYKGRSPKEIADIYNLLVSSGDISIFWHFVFTCLTVAVVYPGVRQGIEYWTRFMTIGLFVLLLGLCCYSATLSGFSEAAYYVFYPDASRFKPSGALEALGLSFFTLSLGQGIMLTYGSYMRRSEDIPQTALIIGSTILVVSVMAALMIFPVIFTFGLEPQGGPGLVFKTLPVLFGKLPGALLISTLFFVLLVFTAITSSVALVEVVAANLIDLLGWPRKKAVLAVGLSCFICGIPSALSGSGGLFANWEPMYGKTFFETVKSLVSVWLLPLGGLGVAIFTGWVVDSEVTREEFQSGTVLKWLWRPWLFFVRYVAPLAILAIFMQMSGLVNIDAWFGK